MPCLLEFMQVLELGIVVHSVIIGISVGTSESAKTIKSLVAALTFHQFFEGMGLGGCISQVIISINSLNFNTLNIIMSNNVLNLLTGSVLFLFKLLCLLSCGF